MQWIEVFAKDEGKEGQGWKGLFMKLWLLSKASTDSNEGTIPATG